MWCIFEAFHPRPTHSPVNILGRLRRLGGRGRHADAPVPAFVETLYLRFRAPRQPVQPLALGVVDLLHRQCGVEGVVQIERQERRPQLAAIIQLQHAVHFDTFGTRIGIMLYACQGFFRIEFGPQFGRIDGEKHVAIHEQHPAGQPHRLGQVRHQETRMAKLRAKRATVSIVQRLAVAARGP